VKELQELFAVIFIRRRKRKKIITGYSTKRKATLFGWCQKKHQKQERKP
jgi:hypothetical protein